MLDATALLQLQSLLLALPPGREQHFSAVSLRVGRTRCHVDLYFNSSTNAVQQSCESIVLGGSANHNELTNSVEAARLAKLCLSALTKHPLAASTESKAPMFPASSRFQFGSLLAMRLVAPVAQSHPRVVVIRSATPALSLCIAFHYLDKAHIILLDDSLFPVDTAHWLRAKADLPQKFWFNRPLISSRCAPEKSVCDSITSTNPRVLHHHSQPPPHWSDSDWLTIVIPTLPGIDLSNALNSIKKQGAPGVRVIVVAGGQSPDPTPDPESGEFVCGRFDWLQCLTLSDNSPYDAMNMALAHAGTEWVYFLGGDDTLADQFVLEDVKDVIDKIPSSTHLIYGDVRMIGAGPGTEHGEIYAGRFDYARLHRQNICHQSIFYKTEILISADGFSSRYRINADWALNIKIWQDSRPTYFNRVIANFARGGLSSTTIDEPFFAELDEMWRANVGSN